MKDKHNKENEDITLEVRVKNEENKEMKMDETSELTSDVDTRIHSDDLMGTSEEVHEIDIDVRKEIDKITEAIRNLRHTAMQMKDAKVKMRDWSFSVSYIEGEYIVDFRMKLSVIPEKM